MPELPEVETISRSLAPNMGAKALRLEFKRTDIIRGEDFAPEELTGKVIKAIYRRGKFLILVFPRHHHLVVHLGMSGRFYMLDKDEEAADKHVHLLIHLNNARKLVYQDARRFGGVWLVNDIEEFFCRMGPEPLGDEFTPRYLAQVLEGRHTAVKNLLLDQHLIAGIGNIYADEALFAAGIRPDRPADSLSVDEVGRLWQAIRDVLKDSIEARGTTFRDYRDGYNQSGGFQHQLRVYGKDDQPCSCCGEPIQKGRIGGRGTHYCGKCQS
ncbi:MAG: bifunctional DNA-formamidopyrimidine glycosylase/DNA-(apurinic or apyrimidinic site) lyase [Deltaproteobacteria bacterium]